MRFVVDAVLYSNFNELEKSEKFDWWLQWNLLKPYSSIPVASPDQPEPKIASKNKNYTKNSYRYISNEISIYFLFPSKKKLFIVGPRAIHSIFSHRNSDKFTENIHNNYTPQLQAFSLFFLAKKFYFPPNERSFRAVAIISVVLEWLTIDFSRAKFYFGKKRTLFAIFHFPLHQWYLGSFKYTHVHFHSKYWWWLVDKISFFQLFFFSFL